MLTLSKLKVNTPELHTCTKEVLDIMQKISIKFNCKKCLDLAKYW